MDKELKQYLDSGDYLPGFLKDFHDQKNLFKRLDKIVQKREDGYTDDMSWTEGHVYTVDIFLWYMAAHGYTLQKSRKKVTFEDVEKDLHQFEQEEREQFLAIFNSMTGSDEVESKKEK